MEENTYQTWNRPTASWKLSCEYSGKTRLAAIEKTTITLDISTQHEHVGNCGLAIVIILSVMCLCPVCAFGC